MSKGNNKKTSHSISCQLLEIRDKLIKKKHIFVITKLIFTNGSRHMSRAVFPKLFWRADHLNTTRTRLTEQIAKYLYYHN
jgi:hypothetical protein